MSHPAPYRTVRHLGLGLVALLGVLQAGCGAGLMPQPATPPTKYLLQVPADAPRLVNAAPSIAINTVRSAAGYGDADMLYVSRAHQLQAFSQHRWVDSPARMLEPILVISAEHSGLFSQVAGPANRVTSDLQLDSELLRLQQVFKAQGSELELAVRVSLIDSKQQSLRASQVIRVTVSAEPTPYGGVLAANKAIALLRTELTTFLDRALAQTAH